LESFAEATLIAFSIRTHRADRLSCGTTRRSGPRFASSGCVPQFCIAAFKKIKEKNAVKEAGKRFLKIHAKG
jgi:hypothetical protein